MDSVKEPRQRLPFPGCPASEVPGPGQGRRGSPSALPSLPPQPAIPEEFLSAANASQQPPSPKLVGLARCSETAFAPNGLYQGENKALESFQRGLVIAARSTGSRSPPVAPHRGHSRVQALSQSPQAVAAAPQLSVPALALPCPVMPGQGPFNKCWPENNGSIFTKKCSAAKSGLAPAANEKIRLVFCFVLFFFFPAAEFLGKLVWGRHWSTR